MDNAASAVALLPEDFRAPVRSAWLSALVRGLDGVATACDGLRYWRDLDSATGIRLDVLGRMLRVKRQGRLDDEYRRALRTEILVLRSDGTPETLLAITRAYLGIDVGHLLLTAYPPAAWVMYYVGVFALQTSLMRLLTRARAGGVDGQLVTYTVTPFLHNSVSDLTVATAANSYSSVYATPAGGGYAHTRLT